MRGEDNPTRHQRVIWWKSHKKYKFFWFWKSLTFQSIRAERGEVILRQVQVDEAPHPAESPDLHLRDLAPLQMERHHLRDSGEAVARDVVEVVATQVQQTRVGREAARDFSVASILTGGVLCCCLRRGGRGGYCACKTCQIAFSHVFNSSQIQISK